MSIEDLLKIPRDTMINLSRHEDDEPLIAKKDLVGTIVKRHGSDAIEVIIPEIDRDRTFYIHQPETSKE